MTGVIGLSHSLILWVVEIFSNDESFWVYLWNIQFSSIEREFEFNTVFAYENSQTDVEFLRFARIFISVPVIFVVFFNVF